MVAIFSLTQAARATVGGPETAAILGWDPAEKKLYYSVHFEGESERLPEVFYLDLNSPRPEVAIPIHLWSEADTSADYRTINSKLEALKRGLVQLGDPMPDTLAVTITTLNIQREWRTPEGDLRPRIDLEIQVALGSLKGTALVTSYCNRQIFVQEWYEIPKLSVAVVHMSYTGQPDEVCYARPVVILARPRTGEGDRPNLTPAPSGWRRR